IPALLSSRSGAACDCKMRFAHAATCSSAETSTAAKSFGAGNCFCNCAISFSERPQPMTTWPSRMNSSVSARPSPRETPVMRMVFGFAGITSVQLLCECSSRREPAHYFKHAEKLERTHVRRCISNEFYPPWFSIRQKLSAPRGGAVVSWELSGGKPAAPVHGKSNRHRNLFLPHLDGCWRNKLF